jgi:hypothetical protein
LAFHLYNRRQHVSVARYNPTDTMDSSSIPMRIGVALILARLAAAADTASPAQNTPATPTTPAAAQATTPTPAAVNTPANTPAPANNNTPSNQQTPAQQSSQQPANNNTPSSAGTTGPTVANGPSVAITGIPSSTSSQSSSSSASQSGSAFGGLTGLPTIEGYSIPSMVVPDTANAPFMKVSTLPEGTVFIIVGAFLAFIGVAVLFWRGLVAYSVHRSVKRANEKLRQPETMKLVKPGVGGASQFTNGSNLSMDHLSTTPGGTLTRKNPNATPRSNIASNAAAARSSSLFFSPTAGPGNHSSTYLPQNRSSSFLPSGFYAAPGAASPAGGAQATHIGTASANRYSRASRYHDVSPPDSPALPPSRGQDSNRRPSHSMYQASTSSLNLNVPGNAHPGGRAPSANLEDMLGDYPLPKAR